MHKAKKVAHVTNTPITGLKQIEILIDDPTKV